MYFLWKRTPHGSIRVSCDGFSGFVNKVLPRKTRCRSLFLTEGENAVMTLVLSSDNTAEECCKIEERLVAISVPLGFQIKVIWADKGSPGAELGEKLMAVYRSPWTWMIVTALVALAIMGGWRRFFWTLFSGTAAWFVSKFAILPLLEKKRIFPYS